MGCDLFFFFNDTATTEIYTLSLHDALPISVRPGVEDSTRNSAGDPSRSAPTTNSSASAPRGTADFTPLSTKPRSEEHTSELQSRQYLVCRLLLEKKKNDHQLQRNNAIYKIT